MLGHSLSALESVDHLVEKDVEKLGAELQLKVQELMHKEFSHSHEGVLPEDQIQRLLASSNQVMNFALSLELQVVHLKQLAPCIFLFCSRGRGLRSSLGHYGVCLWLP